MSWVTPFYTTFTIVIISLPLLLLIFFHFILIFILFIYLFIFLLCVWLVSFPLFFHFLKKSFFLPVFLLVLNTALIIINNLHFLLAKFIQASFFGVLIYISMIWVLFLDVFWWNLLYEIWEKKNLLVIVCRFMHLLLCFLLLLMLSSLFLLIKVFDSAFVFAFCLFFLLLFFQDVWRNTLLS